MFLVFKIILGIGEENYFLHNMCVKGQKLSCGGAVVLPGRKPRKESIVFCFGEGPKEIHFFLPGRRPGIIETEMDENFVKEIAEKQGLTPEDFKKNRESDIPLKRIGKPEDVAKAVVFLASEESSYTIGEAFNVSGGLVMH